MRSVALKYENRFDRHGEIRLMVECDGYVMARRPGRIPFCISRNDWDNLPETAVGADGWSVNHGIALRRVNRDGDIR